MRERVADGLRLVAARLARVEVVPVGRAGDGLMWWRGAAGRWIVVGLN